MGSRYTGGVSVGTGTCSSYGDSLQNLHFGSLCPRRYGEELPVGQECVVV